MNLVYDQKYRISEFLQLYCTVHNLDADCLRINSTSETHHTGDGSKLASCNLPLWGLEQSLKEYGFWTLFYVAAHLVTTVDGT